MNACISSVVELRAASEQADERRVERLERQLLVERILPVVEPVRSPRQCIGPAPAMPRSVCVVIGPFIGWKVQSDTRCRRPVPRR